MRNLIPPKCPDNNLVVILFAASPSASSSCTWPAAALDASGFPFAFPGLVLVIADWPPDGRGSVSKGHHLDSMRVPSCVDGGRGLGGWNEGRYFWTGASKSNLPCSYKRPTAVAVMAFDRLAILIICLLVMGTRFSTSAYPNPNHESVPRWRFGEKGGGERNIPCDHTIFPKVENELSKSTRRTCQTFFHYGNRAARVSILLFGPKDYLACLFEDLFPLLGDGKRRRFVIHGR